MPPISVVIPLLRVIISETKIFICLIFEFVSAWFTVRANGLPFQEVVFNFTPSEDQTKAYTAKLFSWLIEVNLEVNRLLFTVNRTLTLSSNFAAVVPQFHSVAIWFIIYQKLLII